MEYLEDFLNSKRFFVSGEVETIDLPKANVIKLHFEDGWIALRPSGTEPKIKLYVSLETNNIDDEAGKINEMVFELAGVRSFDFSMISSGYGFYSQNFLLQLRPIKDIFYNMR